MCDMHSFGYHVWFNQRRHTVSIWIRTVSIWIRFNLLKKKSRWKVFQRFFEDFFKEVLSFFLKQRDKKLNENSTLYRGFPIVSLNKILFFFGLKKIEKKIFFQKKNDSLFSRVSKKIIGKKFPPTFRWFFFL